MSKESRRTLVVDLDVLEASRNLFLEMAKSYASDEAEILRLEASIVDRIIKAGITVDMDANKVAAWAKALTGVAEIREEIWQRAEREQFYSEADSADADWTPSGGAA